MVVGTTQLMNYETADDDDDDSVKNLSPNVQVFILSIYLCFLHQQLTLSKGKPSLVNPITLLLWP